MATCGNCGKTGATVPEIRECYASGQLVESPMIGGYGTVTPKPEPEPEITDGMWKLGDTIYKVQWNREKTNLYGKRLVVETYSDTTVTSFEYEPGIVRKLTVGRAHKLSLEEAKEFGALYGTCCVCGRTLTNEESIEAGIGPICGGRLA